MKNGYSGKKSVDEIEVQLDSKLLFSAVLISAAKMLLKLFCTRKAAQSSCFLFSCIKRNENNFI